MTGVVPIGGLCKTGFEAVREAFEANFSLNGDLGAAVALHAEGEMVVDLWGGYLEPARKVKWQRDTLVNIWSTTKGIIATCFAMLVDRGQIAYEDEVSLYWPEFGACNKSTITVAMLLSHQAGLAGFREPTKIEDLYDAPSAAAKLAATEPWWEPGTQSGYHPITVGYLATELFRRAEGRSLQQFVAEELQRYDLTIGLPDDRFDRAATLIAPEGLGSTDLAEELTLVQKAAVANPVLDPLLPNSSGWRNAEIPSANGFATASGLASLYGELADGGGRLMTNNALTAATSIQISGPDAIMGIETNWGCGFLLNSLNIFGPNPNTFGHSGWGGSFAFADPDKKIALAFVMNRMGTDLIGDPRAMSLVEATYRSIANG
ncbi:serine hydrolase domain-containing protein [Parasphingorhabdus sp.]|uniref:serine hydrolase domain-containing protein n=1 Tax=Parasphingorhabdus sp. TaxID=2709688 RepID=UPI0032EE1B8E